MQLALTRLSERFKTRILNAQDNMVWNGAKNGPKKVY